MFLGVDYYPEQWPVEMMDADLDTIVELGCNVIRIAEFAWHLIEKKEGQYDFSFFDLVIEKAKARGLKVVMGTPTAAIPAWLAKKYPSILSEFEGGKKRAFGGRHVYCFNSPEMYSYSEKIIRKMVEHYKDEEAIVAWQIDNEIGHEGSDICYCEQCHDAFKKFLVKKWKGDINHMNEVHGTCFWSQQYNSFDEIPIPTETITTHNPALRLDWERFRNESIVNFMSFQRDLVKEIAPNALVMHDFPSGGLDKHVSYADVAKHLDIVAFNNYPVWGGQKEPIPPHEIAFSLDFIRGFKQENFWITEAIMGAQGHDVTGFLPRPNQAKMWSYQGIAHGCESMMYFRYRGYTKGAEQFCYGILDSDNVKRRKFYEVQSLYADIKQYQDVLHTPIRPDVAIVYDYDSVAAFRIQKQSILLDPHAEMRKMYKPFYDLNVPVDIIQHDTDFSKYKVLILPVMIITKEETRKKVQAFVENGGTVVMTYRSAIKDEDNNLVLGALMPVGYDQMAGVQIVETESLQEYNAFPVKGYGICEGKKGYGGVFRDMLVPDSEAEVLYHYGDMFYEEFAAVTRKSCGKGRVYYLGCSLDDGTLNDLSRMILKEQSILTIPTEDGAEIVIRGEGDNKIVMMMNHNAHDVKIGTVVLAPFESKIIRVTEEIRNKYEK